MSSETRPVVDWSDPEGTEDWLAFTQPVRIAVRELKEMIAAIPEDTPCPMHTLNQRTNPPARWLIDRQRLEVLVELLEESADHLLGEIEAEFCRDETDRGQS